MMEYRSEGECREIAPPRRALASSAEFIDVAGRCWLSVAPLPPVCGLFFLGSLIVDELVSTSPVLVYY
uniref:Uncharacterized protein n=1 Tax=Ascaris lumbricoides TaxID=6252 RepID=A0A0M3HXV0_ASCLU